MDINRAKSFKFILPYLLWIMCTFALFHHLSLRQTISSLSSYLVHDFHLNILDISNLAAAFAISYVIFLPIAGVLIDLFSIQVMLSVSLFIAACACFIFSASVNEAQLILVRILIGISTAISFVSAFVIIRQYFKTSLFSILAGLTFSISLLGGIAGSWGLESLSNKVHWNSLIAVAGFFALALMLIVLLLAPHCKKITLQPSEKVSLKQFFKDIGFFVRQKKNWIPGLYGGCIIVPFASFASFWSPPFLSLHYNISHTEAQYFTSYIFLGYIIGAPIFGILAQEIGLKASMLLASIMSLLVFLLLNFSILSVAFLPLLLFLLGFSVGSYALTTVVIRCITPEDITGSALSFSNMLSQIIGAFVLWIIGFYIHYMHGVNFGGGTAKYSLLILNQAMNIITLFLFLGILMACFVVVPKIEDVD